MGLLEGPNSIIVFCVRGSLVLLSFASIYDAPPLELDSRIGRLVKLIFKELRLIECPSVVWEGLSGMDYRRLCPAILVWHGTLRKMNDCQHMQRWNDSSVVSLGGFARSEVDAARLQRGG
jgi:hypothetical protein